MEMICQGPNCGVVFEAKRKTAKYHSNKCSVAASRAGQQGEPTPAPKGARKERKRPGFVIELGRRTRETLEAVDRLDTWPGQAAMALAYRIDEGGAETGSALASMIKAHSDAMDRALAQAHQGDPVEKLQGEVKARAEDDLARQRERRARP